MNILFLLLIFTVLLRPVESVHFRVCVGPMWGAGGHFCSWSMSLDMYMLETWDLVQWYCTMRAFENICRLIPRFPWLCWRQHFLCKNWKPMYYCIFEEPELFLETRFFNSVFSFLVNSIFLKIKCLGTMARRIYWK